MSFFLKKLTTLTAVAVTVSLTACVNDGGGSESDREELKASEANTVISSDAELVNLFTAIADNVVIPNLEEFELTARVAASATGPISQYCASIGSADETAELADAQQAWTSVMGLFQKADAFPLGPISANENSLRNRLYSWPSDVNQCSVDVGVVSLSEDTDFDITTRSAQAKGLDALEYLLFKSDLTHTCPSQITDTQTWNARTELERKQLRCAYAEAVAGDIATNSLILLNAWKADQGNYRGDLISAGDDGSSFTTQEEALIAILDAIFYLDTDVKGSKVGVPTGIDSSCSGFSCSGNVEAPFTNNALNYVLSNLKTFRAVFTGSYTVDAVAVGLDDELAARGFTDTATNLLALTDALIARLEASSANIAIDSAAIDTLDEQTECTNSAATPSAASIEICGVYGFLREITDELRGDVLTVLSLELPSRVEGDND